LGINQSGAREVKGERFSHLDREPGLWGIEGCIGSPFQGDSKSTSKGKKKGPACPVVVPKGDDWHIREIGGGVEAGSGGTGGWGGLGQKGGGEGEARPTAGIVP